MTVDESASDVAAALGGCATGWRPLSGGASRVTAQLDWTTAEGAARTSIVQIDRLATGGLGLGAPREAALLAAARAANVPVPAVEAAGMLAADGRRWLAVEYLEGETIARRILRDERWAVARAALVDQCGTALARIHAIAPESIPHHPLGDRRRDPGPMLEAVGLERPALELGRRWLRTTDVPTAGDGLVHGDFRLGNLLVDDRGLRAVLDWELAHRGDPAEDLGWLCARTWRFGGPGEVAGLGALDDLLAAYRAAGGTEITVAQVRWWEGYAALRWAAICALQASTHLTGQHRSLELATIGRRVVESEWDLLLLMGASVPIVPYPGTESAAMPFGRPTAAELVEALGEEFARRAGGEPTFADRVAQTALGIVERELRFGDDVIARRRERLADAGFASEGDLVAQLRAGALDDRLMELVPLVAASTFEELAINNPRHAGFAPA